MARKLRVLTHAIDGHLAQRFGSVEDMKGKRVKPVRTMPDPVRVAFLQGEAMLRLGFFEFCDSKRITDPASQMKIWDRLVARRHVFIELCERSTLNKYSRKLLPEIAGQDYSERCFTLFCLLLFDMGEKAAPFLAGVWGHYVGQVMRVST